MATSKATSKQSAEGKKPAPAPKEPQFPKGKGSVYGN